MARLRAGRIWPGLKMSAGHDAMSDVSQSDPGPFTVSQMAFMGFMGRPGGAS